MDIIQEEAILAWEAEKAGADEADRVFLKQSEKLIEVRCLCSVSTCYQYIKYLASFLVYFD